MKPPFSTILLLFCSVLTLIACKTREIGNTEKTALVQEGKKIFSDDFERTEVGENWNRGSGEGGKGEWRIKDGWLLGSALKNDPLWLDKKLPEYARVEFEAEALSPTGDLKWEIFGDGENHASGYIVIFGGWNNTLDVIARLDEHGDDRKARRTEGVVPNRVYAMAIERGKDGALRWFVDGKLHMTYDDPDPLTGDGHRYFAFSNWMAPVKFDNLRVYDLE